MSHGYNFEDDWEILQNTRGRGHFKDLTGTVFGRLTAIERVGADRHGSALWNCHCSCGNEKVVARRDLRTKAVQSCGCLQAEARKRPR